MSLLSDWSVSYARYPWSVELFLSNSIFCITYVCRYHILLPCIFYKPHASVTLLRFLWSIHMKYNRLDDHRTVINSSGNYWSYKLYCTVLSPTTQHLISIAACSWPESSPPGTLVFISIRVFMVWCGFELGAVVSVAWILGFAKRLIWKVTAPIIKQTMKLILF